MNSDTLHRWLTLAANLGVLFGLILLVVELGQNRSMMMAQTRNELSSGVVELFVRVAENPELADLRRRADEGEVLSDREFYQYAMVTRAFFRYWENVHYQYRHGMYDDLEFSRQRVSWRQYAERSPALVRYWCDQRSGFSDMFVAEFNALMPPGACSSAVGSSAP